MEFKGTPMEFKGTPMEFKGVRTKFQSTSLGFNGSRPKSKDPHLERQRLRI
jgi:hypothetical protein